MAVFFMMVGFNGFASAKLRQFFQLAKGNVFFASRDACAPYCVLQIGRKEKRISTGRSFLCESSDVGLAVGGLCANDIAACGDI